ncbi:MAG: hypothetical protein RL456_3104 [Pseudomonadota bacterium]|jgi:hypothetical protein
MNRIRTPKARTPRSRLAGLALAGLSALAALAPAPAAASPLAMRYGITDPGTGVIGYQFELTLDNHDGSWAPGQAWAWLVFGDRFGEPSPLTDFVGDPADLPIGPWTFYTDSGGGNNGPTLGPVLSFWEPAAVGETLRWSGTSTGLVYPGHMRYSTLLVRGGAQAAWMEVATMHPVPEAPSWALLVAGLALLAGRAARTDRRSDAP